MTIDLSKVTPELITAAIKIADVDEAFCSMMTPAGITDGGIADMAFERDDWAPGDEQKRRDMIAAWIELEKLYLPDPAEKATTAIEHAIRTAQPTSPQVMIYAWGPNDAVIIGPFKDDEAALKFSESRLAGGACQFSVLPLCRPEDYPDRDAAKEALFKIFQMTRVYCDDLGKALDDSMWDDGGHKGIGFLYGGLFIEIVQDWWPEEAKAEGRYSLLMYNRQPISNDLESLERELFEFAACENSLTFEQATDDLTVDLFEGEGAGVGDQRQHVSRGELREIIKENQDSMVAEEVATMRKALVEKGTYRISIGLAGCFWDVVLVKPADPATFPPKTTITFFKHGDGPMLGWDCFYSAQNDVHVWVETRADGFYLVENRFASNRGPYTTAEAAAIAEEAARAAAKLEG